MIEDQYVDRIMYEIEVSTIRKKEIKDDLLDHFCCLVEMDMKKGLTFEEAYKKAYEQTCPEGLNELQRETVFLLNYKILLFMKRATFISGYVFTALITLGALFKVLHLPGAMIMLIIGLTGFAVVFLPLLLVNHFRRNLNFLLSEKLKWALGLLSAIALTAGTLFKILHFPGAALMLGVGALLFVFGFLPFLFFRMYRNSMNEL